MVKPIKGKRSIKVVIGEQQIVLKHVESSEFRGVTRSTYAANIAGTAEQFKLGVSTDPFSDDLWYVMACCGLRTQLSTSLDNVCLEMTGTIHDLSRRLGAVAALIGPGEKSAAGLQKLLTNAAA